MKEIINYLNNNRNNIINLTERLISIPTVNPPGENYERIVAVLERECKSSGLKVTRRAVPKNYLAKKGITKGSQRINLIADWQTRSKKTLHMAGHYDVVPAGGKWRTDPFKPVLKQGRIYGRGAEDMKGNIASMIFAVKALKACGVKPGVNIQLSFSPDEEIGGETGFGWLIKNNLIKADYAISEGYSDGWVSCGNKGVVWFDVEVLGKSAHASSPSRGINSFEKMIKVANALLALKEKTEKKKTRYLTRYEIDRRATFVMGGELEGGGKVNIVPDKSSFSIDRRLLPEETAKDAIRQVKKVITRLMKKDKDLRANIKVRTSNNASISDTKNPLFKAFKKASRQITGASAREALLSGATDLRFLMERRVPCLGYSARGGQKWHSDNEFIYVSSLIKTSQILSHTILYLT